MKKLFALFVVAGVIAFASCGGTDKKDAEQIKKDSIKKADSIATAEADLAKIEQAKADSIAVIEDSLKKKEEKKDEKKGGK